MTFISFLRVAHRTLFLAGLLDQGLLLVSLRPKWLIDYARRSIHQLVRDVVQGLPVNEIKSESGHVTNLESDIVTASSITYTLYLLWFVSSATESEDSGILIGVYSSESAAKSAVARLEGKPGFVDYPSGFQIWPRVLNEDSWTEGFVKD